MSVRRESFPFIMGILGLGLFLTGGCSPKMKGKDMIAAYREGMAEGSREIVEVLREDFKRQRPLGYEEPVVPMVVPPETLLLWFGPETTGQDVFVQGHWVLFVVRGWEWNPEILSTPKGADGGNAKEVPLPLHPDSKSKESGK